MPAKAYPTDILEQAQSVLDAWKQISQSLNFGELNVESLANDIAQANPILSQINTLDAQLTNLRNQRDALYESMWSKVKRVRSGIKSNYGDDSSEYEMIGGTRLSERKTATRKTASA